MTCWARRTGPLAAALALLFLSPAGRASAWGNVPIGTKIPELSLPSTVGQKVTVSAAGSKALLILYLRPNHERSAAALADVVKLFTAYKDKGLKVLAVSTVKTETPAIKALAKKLKVPFPVLIDAKEEFYGRFGVFVHPVTGVVDQDNVLRYEFSSYRQGYQLAVERQLKAVLGLGPAPEKIVDLDRSAASHQDLALQRQAKMKEVEHKLALLRARRRLIGAREMLRAESLGLVFKLYIDWASKLPPPADPALAAAAAAVAEGKNLAVATAKLRELGRKKERTAEASLWLGRALVAQKKPADAKRVFEKCVGQPPLSGQCEFELARLLAEQEPTAAVALCKKAYSAAFNE